MTFYDYGMHVFRGKEFYRLHADGKPLPHGRVCSISPSHRGGWIRTTQWNSIHGLRHRRFDNLDDALASGIAWAKRRERKESGG